MMEPPPYTLPPHTEDDAPPSWARPNSEAEDIAIAMGFKSMLQPQPQPDSYFNFNFNSAITTTTTPFVPNMDSVSFPLVPFSPPLSLPFFNNTFGPGFDMGLDTGLHSSPSPLFPQTGFEFGELEALPAAAPFVPNGPVAALKPVEAVAQPTLYRKRRGTAEIPGLETVRRKWEGEEGSSSADVDASGLNYESDEENENVGSGLNLSENGGGDQKGKKKGMPAKNLMAERRRRKKLNDRLYMLRSVVPKISKMDRASILGDAIEYLKELLHRINELHTELESTPPPGSLLPPSNSTSFHPLTPTLPAPTLPGRVKEELYPGTLPSLKNQAAKVEVRAREGRAVNIHMFCTRRPGLLLSTMRALDNLGLDVQQAVISCFNGFALDVFKAEQCREGQDVPPEQIKAVLLDSAGFHHGMM